MLLVRRGFLALAIAAIFCINISGGPVQAAPPALKQVRSFIYALPVGVNTPGFLQTVAASPHDLIIMSGGDTKTTLNRSIADPTNSKLLFNYVDLTEAASYSTPSLFANGTKSAIVGRPVPGFNDLYSVQYWDPLWKVEVLRQIDGVIAAGYDGVFLDVVTPDAWEANNAHGNPVRATALADLAALVDSVVSHVKAKSTTRPFYLMANGPLKLAQQHRDIFLKLDSAFQEWVYWGQPLENGYTSVYKGTDVATALGNTIAPAYEGTTVFAGDYPLPMSNNDEVFRSFSLYNALGWVPTITKAYQDDEVMKTGPFVFIAKPDNSVVVGGRSVTNLIGGAKATAATLTGGDKDDFFIGGPGTNTMSGGAGNDTFYAHPDTVPTKNDLKISVRSDLRNVAAPTFSVQINGKTVFGPVNLTESFQNGQTREIAIDTTEFEPVTEIKFVATVPQFVNSTTFANVQIQSVQYQTQRLSFTNATFGSSTGALDGGARAIMNGGTNSITMGAGILPVAPPTFGLTASAIDGGTGSNTAIYRFPSSNYTMIAQADGSFMVTSRSTAEGPDTLRNIQFVKFSDRTISLPTGTAERRFGPVFSSSAPTSLSFIRLSNTSSTPGIVVATLRDPLNGQSLGQWSSPAIAANTSQQYPISTIELPLGSLTTRPTTYALSLRSGISGHAQHVLYRPADGTLTNLSTCDASVTANAAQLINVHSSILDFGFPSTVVVKSTGSAAASATLGIFDSTTGAKYGTYSTASIPAGGQARVSVADIQTALGFTPGASTYHYNIQIEGNFAGFLQHLVTNKQAGVITDMTTVCSFGTASSTPGSTPRLPSVYSTAQTSSQSFLRFHNTGSSSGTARISLRNDVTGAQLALWNSPTIAPGASRQFSIDEIEKGVGTSFTKPATYSLSIEPQMAGFLQHVLYRPADGTLTNLSTCDAGVTTNPTELINVHSTILDFGFPSTVVVANTGSAAAMVTLGVYDSTNGTKLGTYTTASIPANGQLNLGIAAIEQAAKISPGTTIYHYNIKAETAYTGFLQHLVTNKQAGVITDMTTVCRLN